MLGFIAGTAGLIARYALAGSMGATDRASPLRAQAGLPVAAGVGGALPSLLVGMLACWGVTHIGAACVSVAPLRLCSPTPAWPHWRWWLAADR